MPPKAFRVAEDIEKQAECFPKRRGAPTSFDNSYIDLAFRFCLLGATDGELAAHFNVARSTISLWKKQYPEFSDAIKKGKKPADAVVAHALFERARGATWIEEAAIKCKTVEWIDGHKIETERVEVVQLHKAAPPDTTACIFYLKNRDKEHWSDVQKFANPDGTPIFPQKITVEVVKAQEPDNAAS